MAVYLASASLICLVALAAAFLLGCNGASGTNGSDVQSTVAIELRSGSGLRGLSMTLTTAARFSVVAVSPHDSPLSSATCEANIDVGTTRAACVATTSFSSPLDAWHVTLAHPSDRTALEGITSLTCEGSDSTGATFAVSCVAVAR